MTQPQNIECFDEFVARALAELYGRFPVKIFLDARKLSGDDGNDDFGRVVDSDGRPSKRFEIALATIEWLADSGIIRAGEPHTFGYYNVVLTAAGLEILQATPESLKVGESLGDRITRFVREGSLGFAKEAAKAAISATAGRMIGP